MFYSKEFSLFTPISWVNMIKLRNYLNVVVYEKSRQNKQIVQ